MNIFLNQLQSIRFQFPGPQSARCELQAPTVWIGNGNGVNKDSNYPVCLTVSVCLLTSPTLTRDSDFGDSNNLCGEKMKDFVSANCIIIYSQWIQLCIVGVYPFFKVHCDCLADRLFHSRVTNQHLHSYFSVINRFRVSNSSDNVEEDNGDLYGAIPRSCDGRGLSEYMKEIGMDTVEIAGIVTRFVQ